ncbi:disulfide bond formation protein B [Microvirga lenta]|uniref:disulfide bond formation protein B n=1 Tax=Microvirga lenta TaxID=2881337 RepID=UPI001CFFBF11|nr:disulfide bond formation protein B [Microvirga lenta]MCB5177682.1 disulfide bond formation protein B [Microvirga lenta]
MRLGLTIRQAALAVALAAAATIGGALVFEHVWGYQPCKLCLTQRNPYYLAIPLALIAAFLPAKWGRIGLWLLALVFVVSAGLGAYHAGVEWGFWEGPSDCGGAMGSSAGNVGDFLNQLQTTRVVSCTEAAWRFLGLSLAGWNVLISLALAAFAAWAAVQGSSGNERAGTGAYGSSSLSQ